MNKYGRPWHEDGLPCSVPGCPFRTHFATKEEESFGVQLCNPRGIDRNVPMEQDHFLSWHATDFDPQWLRDQGIESRRSVCAGCDIIFNGLDFLCERCRADSTA